MPKGQAAPDTTRWSPLDPDYGRRCSHAHNGKWSGDCNEPDLQNLMDIDGFADVNADTSPQSIVETELQMDYNYTACVEDRHAAPGEREVETRCQTGDNLIRYSREAHVFNRIRSTICLVGVNEWHRLRRYLIEVFDQHSLPIPEDDAPDPENRLRLQIDMLKDHMGDLSSRVSPHFADCVGSFNAMVRTDAQGNRIPAAPHQTSSGSSQGAGAAVAASSGTSTGASMVPGSTGQGAMNLIASQSSSEVVPPGAAGGTSGTTGSTGTASVPSAAAGAGGSGLAPPAHQPVQVGSSPYLQSSAPLGSADNALIALAQQCFEGAHKEWCEGFSRQRIGQLPGANLAHTFTDVSEFRKRLAYAVAMILLAGPDDEDNSTAAPALARTSRRLKATGLLVNGEILNEGPISMYTAVHRRVNPFFGRANDLGEEQDNGTTAGTNDPAGDDDTINAVEAGPAGRTGSLPRGALLRDQRAYRATIDRGVAQNISWCLPGPALDQAARDYLCYLSVSDQVMASPENGSGGIAWRKREVAEYGATLPGGFLEPTELWVAAALVLGVDVNLYQVTGDWVSSVQRLVAASAARPEEQVATSEPQISAEALSAGPSAPDQQIIEDATSIIPELIYLPAPMPEEAQEEASLSSSGPRAATSSSSSSSSSAPVSRAVVDVGGTPSSTAAVPNTKKSNILLDVGYKLFLRDTASGQLRAATTSDGDNEDRLVTHCDYKGLALPQAKEQNSLSNRKKRWAEDHEQRQEEVAVGHRQQNQNQQNELPWHFQRYVENIILQERAKTGSADNARPPAAGGHAAAGDDSQNGAASSDPSTSRQEGGATTSAAAGAGAAASATTPLPVVYPWAVQNIRYFFPQHPGRLSGADSALRMLMYQCLNEAAHGRWCRPFLEHRSSRQEAERLLTDVRYFRSKMVEKLAEVLRAGNGMPAADPEHPGRKLVRRADARSLYFEVEMRARDKYGATGQHILTNPEFSRTMARGQRENLPWCKKDVASEPMASGFSEPQLKYLCYCSISDLTAEEILHFSAAEHHLNGNQPPVSGGFLDTAEVWTAAALVLGVDVGLYKFTTEQLREMDAARSSRTEHTMPKNVRPEIFPATSSIDEQPRAGALRLDLVRAELHGFYNVAGAPLPEGEELAQWKPLRRKRGPHEYRYVLLDATKEQNHEQFHNLLRQELHGEPTAATTPEVEDVAPHVAQPAAADDVAKGVKLQETPADLGAPVAVPGQQERTGEMTYRDEELAPAGDSESSDNSDSNDSDASSTGGRDAGHPEGTEPAPVEPGVGRAGPEAEQDQVDPRSPLPDHLQRNNEAAYQATASAELPPPTPSEAPVHQEDHAGAEQKEQVFHPAAANSQPAATAPAGLVAEGVETVAELTRPVAEGVATVADPAPPAEPTLAQERVATAEQQGRGVAVPPPIVVPAPEEPAAEQERPAVTTSVPELADVPTAPPAAEEQKPLPYPLSNKSWVFGYQGHGSSPASSGDSGLEALLKQCLEEEAHAAWCKPIMDQTKSLNFSRYERYSKYDIPLSNVQKFRLAMVEQLDLILHGGPSRTVARNLVAPEAYTQRLISIYGCPDGTRTLYDAVACITNTSSNAEGGGLRRLVDVVDQDDFAATIARGKILGLRNCGNSFYRYPQQWNYLCFYSVGDIDLERVPSPETAEQLTRMRNKDGSLSGAPLGPVELWVASALVMGVDLGVHWFYQPETEWARNETWWSKTWNDPRTSKTWNETDLWTFGDEWMSFVLPAPGSSISPAVTQSREGRGEMLDDLSAPASSAAARPPEAPAAPEISSKKSLSLKLDVVYRFDEPRKSLQEKRDYGRYHEYRGLIVRESMERNWKVTPLLLQHLEEEEQKRLQAAAEERARREEAAAAAAAASLAAAAAASSQATEIADDWRRHFDQHPDRDESDDEYDADRFGSARPRYNAVDMYASSFGPVLDSDGEKEEARPASSSDGRSRAATLSAAPRADQDSEAASTAQASQDDQPEEVEGAGEQLVAAPEGENENRVAQEEQPVLMAEPQRAKIARPLTTTPGLSSSVDQAEQATEQHATSSAFPTAEVRADQQRDPAGTGPVVARLGGDTAATSVPNAPRRIFPGGEGDHPLFKRLGLSPKAVPKFSLPPPSPETVAILRAHRRAPAPPLPPMPSSLAAQAQVAEEQRTSSVFPTAGGSSDQQRDPAGAGAAVADVDQEQSSRDVSPAAAPGDDAAPRPQGGGRTDAPASDADGNAS
ncbi:unnamed protein product [Amoebophrya sp. A120]|nr:unnamed protein product [Amoebophrya sp. A120]|eukprot:GSA120T00016374001.1